MAERKLRTPRALTDGDRDREAFFDELIRQIERLQALVEALEARIVVLETP